MPQNYTPEFKKKIVRLHAEEGRTKKVLLRNIGYRMPAFPSDTARSAKNARQKPSQIWKHQMKWNLWKRTSSCGKNWWKEKIFLKKQLIVAGAWPFIRCIGDMITILRPYTNIWMPSSTCIPSSIWKDRSVVASITDRHITSDQGSRYTSKAFVGFCESVHVTHSMSKAGYPYDNATMERYFNTLKDECANLYEFRTGEALYQTVEKFAYGSYNHVRPHSFNNYHTPYQARIAS